VNAREALAEAEARLAAAGVEAPRADADWLVAHLLGTTRSGLGARLEDEVDGLEPLLGRREAREPLAYVLGEWGFRRLTLKTDARALVPRPETETLVERVLVLAEEIERPRILDIGVGSGAIALALKDERPDAQVTGVDVSADALALARANAERLGLDIRVEEGDGFEPLASDLRRRVDLVVSNPPYLEAAEWASLPADVRADPRDALIGGIVVLERLAVDALGWLRPGGSLVLEIGQTQGGVMRSSLAERYDDVRVERDLTGRDRVAIARAR
jgi:release factor glutamine methyltransferase